MMFKRFFAIIVLPLILLVGCSDKLELDQTTISLIMGVDPGETEKFKIYQTNPVFSKEAQKKFDAIRVEASSIREARKMLDSQSSGNVLTRKLQVFLISKELLKETDIFPYLDVFYRDPKNAINARLVVVDGNVKDIIEFESKDKPRISIYISELIDTTKRNESTVRATFQRFSWQNYEKGITPMVSEIKLKGEEIEVTGTALLNKEGLYTMSLNKHESALLLLLREKFEYPVPITLELKNEDDEEKQNEISFDIHNVKYKVDTGYQDGKFTFNIDLGMSVLITENLSNFNLDKKKIVKQVEQAFKRDIKAIINKAQQHKLAPFGLGQYARAYEYDNWKKVEDKWPKSFSEAKITVNTKVKIKGKGIMENQ